MLHTNFQGHWPFGSGEEDFLRFLPYIVMAATLVMWPGPFEQTFVPPSHGGSIWNLTLIGQVVSEEKMFKECGRRRRTDNGACLYYKITYEQPKGSGELKTPKYQKATKISESTYKYQKTPKYQKATKIPESTYKYQKAMRNNVRWCYSCLYGL